VPFREVVFRDVRIHGSLVCSPEQAKRMLEVVAKHKISVSKNVFNGLAEIPKLIELAHSGKLAGKGMIVVDPQQIEEERKTGVELV
jgi:alcohol dehydrogenase, propanol-preferring